MNRIFHARIAVGQYLFIILAGAMAVYGLWEKNILIAVLFMLLLVVSIEKLIHTTYTVTADNRLLLFFGRFFAWERDFVEGYYVGRTYFFHADREICCYALCIGEVWRRQVCGVASCKRRGIYTVVETKYVVG